MSISYILLGTKCESRKVGVDGGSSILSKKPRSEFLLKFCFLPSLQKLCGEEIAFLE